jgi:hypothetical protein
MSGTGGGIGGGIATKVEEAGPGARDPRCDLPFTGVTLGGLPFTDAGFSMPRLHARLHAKWIAMVATPMGRTGAGCPGARCGTDGWGRGTLGRGTWV